MKLYLDFYQFMNFALTKDQDFREFMREIKAKRKSNKEGKKNDEEDEGYLPMNFNLMFDYFLMKGKERASYEEIQKSIVEMDKIINNNNKNNENDNDDNKSRKYSNEANDTNNKNTTHENINDINSEYDVQLKNLNFINLINNFTT